MKRLMIALMTTLLGVISADLGRAEAAQSSVDSGKSLALLVCSYCHVVSPEQVVLPKLASIQRTPSFEEIANNPKTTARSLRSFITTTHWDEKTLPMTMPNPLLMDEQRDDVVRYILSLRKHR